MPPLSPWAAVLLVAFAAVVATLPPLHETDLAQHLATGEWIVQHRTVPFTEPFAWTREGQPYFAYSWLAQLLFYVLLRGFGPGALHLLEGALVGGSVAAALWAGRQFGWQPRVRIAIAVLHLALLWGVANTLRPQQVLFLTLPLAWGVAARIHARGPNIRRLLALAGIGALTANTHIFFPLTAVPVAYFMLTDRRPQPWLAAAVALVIGWLLTPYALVWPDVFALNFGHNLLLGRPPSIAEFFPGFEYSVHRPGVIAGVVALIAAPWVAAAEPGSRRERVVRALFWAAGLVLFAYAGRLVFAWWVLALPLVGLAAQRIVRAADAPMRHRFGRLATTGAAGIVLLGSAPPISPVFWLFEGDTVHRMLPRGGEDPALWLPSWLLCNTRTGAHGRIFTEFNYGSELTWRLPGYSPSIDGRTIFPDSIAVDFTFQNYGVQRRYASTWTNADVALLDRSFWLAPVLDRDPAWVLLAQGRRTSRGSLGALWAKRAWWQEWGTATALPVLDLRPGDPRGSCSATGTFPKD